MPLRPPGSITILDGPLGTELAARGVATPPPAWSAAALPGAAGVVAAIHRDYASAGATVHTANTFRTRPGSVGRAWGELADRAVALARDAVPAWHRVAGSLAPIEDCYRPDLSPAEPRPEHREVARRLASGVDLLLCETFPHVGEALVAVEESVATGRETWVSFTPGPTGDLLTPAEVEAGAREAVARGAGAVLVNCLPVEDVPRYLDALARAGVPFGAYANAGAGWAWSGRPEAYAAQVLRWIDLGATIVGGCCGTGPAHIHAINDRVGRIT